MPPRLFLIIFMLIQSHYVLSAQEVEPNDTLVTSTLILLGGAEYSGQLYSTDDKDYYKFTSNDSGVVEVLIRPENANYDGGSIKVSVLNSNQNVLGSLVLGSDSTEKILRASVISSTYYILVEKRDNYKTFSKDYIFSASIDTTMLREIEPNDTQLSASSLPSVSSSANISGNVASAADIDWFSIDVEKESILIVKVEPEDEKYDGGAIYAQFLNSQGIMYSAIKVSSDIGYKELKAKVDKGTYFVKISQYENTKLMNKDYFLSTSIDVNQENLSSREKESNDSILTSNIKRAEQVITGQLSSNNDIDIYTITSTYTGVIEYTVGPIVEQYDGGAIGLSIINDSGEILTTRPAGSDYSNSVSFFAYEGNSYSLVVQKYYDEFAYFGPAYLKVFDKDYFLKPKYPVGYSYELEKNDDCSIAKNISNESHQYGLIHVYEDIDCYPFTTLSGGNASFDISPIFSAYDGGVIKVTLTNDAGNIIVSKDITSDALAPINISLHNSLPSDYFLKVTRKDGARMIDDREYYISIEIDSDGDTLINLLDYDDDNDGTNDELDRFSLDPTETVDSDNDGVGNNADLDDDNDGILDNTDNCPLIVNINQSNTDDDDMGNKCDSDDDNDGLSDDWELSNGTNSLIADSSGDIDNDGYTNLQEYLAESNSKLDTDNDGMFDIWEIEHGFQPDDDSDCPSWMCTPSKLNGWRSTIYQ